MNYDTAMEVEALARQRGVVPATIGLVDGALIVGLTSDHIKRMATSEV